MHFRSRAPLNSRPAHLSSHRNGLEISTKQFIFLTLLLVTSATSTKFYWELPSLLTPLLEKSSNRSRFVGFFHRHYFFEFEFMFIESKSTAAVKLSDFSYVLSFHWKRSRILTAATVSWKNISNGEKKSHSMPRHQIYVEGIKRFSLDLRHMSSHIFHIQLILKLLPAASLSFVEPLASTDGKH